MVTLQYTFSSFGWAYLSLDFVEISYVQCEERCVGGGRLPSTLWRKYRRTCFCLPSRALYILVLVHCVDSFRDENRGGVDKELHVFLNKNKVCADPEMESFPIYYISSGRTRVSVVAMSALSAVTTFEWLAIEFEQFERQLGKTSAVFIPHKLEAAAGGGRLLAEADAQLSKTKGRAVQERSSGAAAGYFMLELAAHLLHVCGHPWSAPLGRVNPTRVLANVHVPWYGSSCQCATLPPSSDCCCC